MELTQDLQAKSMKIDQVAVTAKVVDVSKYNLRCHRIISEKMTKKDFIYDIRRPLQGSRKYEEQKQRLPIIDPIRMRKQTHSNSKIPKYSISKNGKMGGGGDGATLSLHRALNFKCNFCHQPIATLFSLSTHVKSHMLEYCKKCYWILEESETMEGHIKKTHDNRPVR